MKKRVISVVLTFAILIALTCSTVCAKENSNESQKEYLFEELFDAPDVWEYYYEELYYHYVIENDQESEIDWAIVRAYYALEPMGAMTIVLDRVIQVNNFATPFPVRLAVYDAKLNEFISIDKIDVTRYNGIEKALEELKIGNPFGDADFDGKLSVLDATYIQRVLAQLCEFNIYDEWGEIYVSDFDHDGERTILDATAIQIKLAKID